MRKSIYEAENLELDYDSIHEKYFLRKDHRKTGGRSYTTLKQVRSLIHTIVTTTSINFKIRTRAINQMEKEFIEVERNTNPPNIRTIKR